MIMMVQNAISYDDYVENDYAANGRHDEGHDGGGYYDDGTNVYASWRLGYIMLLLWLLWTGYVMQCFVLAVFALDFRML